MAESCRGSNRSVADVGIGIRLCRRFVDNGILAALSMFAALTKEREQAHCLCNDCNQRVIQTKDVEAGGILWNRKKIWSTWAL